MARQNTAKGPRNQNIRRNSLALSSKEKVAGFNKRRTKAARPNGDVYEYQPEKNRRANVSLSLDEDESMGMHGDGDPDPDSFEAQLKNRPRLVGTEDDDGLATDEDEDIDSDEAFGTSDEERYADFNFKKYKKKATTSRKLGKKPMKKVTFAEVDLDEDEDMSNTSESSGDDSKSERDEEEEGDDDEFIDVLDVLDGRGIPKFDDEDDGNALGSDGKPEDSQREPKVLDRRNGSLAEDSDQGNVSNEDDEDSSGEGSGLDDHFSISGSDEEADPSALDALGNFLTGLETGTKRKLMQDDTKDEDELRAQAKKKMRPLKDRTEAGTEGEFGAKVASSSKLSLDDLLTPLVSQPSVASSLKKSMKPLASSSNAKNQPLPAPLPTRTQERIDREAAYEQTKQEVDKWSETMKKIQEAEHLSFPLQTPKTVKVSNLELAAKFKPETELESSIDRLLKSAKLREEDINKTEDLMMKELTVEEVAERRAELRKMRELAFRADAKAKRVSKIKSKAYRRIHKKERAKLLEKLDAGDIVNEEEERLKAEIDRARERATLKHKNTGKWAKAMRARGELDESQRRDVNEMLERGEKLRRRIQGVGSGSDDNESDGSGSEFDGEDGVMRAKADAFEELAQLRSVQNADDEEELDKRKSESVFQMKFMKDAAARQNKEVDRMIDDFRKEMGDIPAESDREEKGEENERPMQGERVNGRMVFRPAVQARSLNIALPPPLSAISETSTLRSHDSVSAVPDLAIHDTPDSPPVTLSSTVNLVDSQEGTNPWLALPEFESANKIAKRRNELLIGKDATRIQKSADALHKRMQKTEEERERQNDDVIVEITLDDTLKISGNDNTRANPLANGTALDKKKKKKKSKKKDAGRNIEPSEVNETDVDSEIEEQEAALRKGGKVKAFEQRELVARAFAGDNVVQQFEEEKRKEIEADAPREVDTTLPGWGSWGGAGTKKAPAKPHLIKKVAGIDPKSRADYGKANVMISEKRDKKAEKYAVRDLPYPYTSKAQFDALMSTPLGVEWNTRLSFQRGTLPRVVKKMGTVIEPLEKL